MMKFRVYPSQLIHYGKPDPDPEKPSTGWFWVSLCGRELVGHLLEHEPEGWEPVCRRCQRSFEHGQRVYQGLEKKFG